MESARCDHIDTIGKLVRGDRYVHVSGISALTDTTRSIINKAVSVTELKVEADFNVVKIRRGNSVISLLRYPMFFEEAFPALDRSVIVDIINGSIKSRTYNAEANRPILHKKELLLDHTHPQRRMFELFTEQLEIRNIKPNKPGLGFKRQWETYLGIMGVAVKNHQLMDL